MVSSCGKFLTILPGNQDLISIISPNSLGPVQSLPHDRLDHLYDCSEIPHSQQGLKEVLLERETLSNESREMTVHDNNNNIENIKNNKVRSSLQSRRDR